MAPPPTEQPTTRFPWLTRSEQLLWAFCLAIGIGLLSFQAWHRFSRSDDFIDIDRAPPLRAEYQVDLNSADWPELTVLPGISETFARQIIEFRDLQGPIQNVDDLLNIPGIGEKRLAQLRPYLIVKKSESAKTD